MTTSSTNYTSLYSGNVSGAVPNTAYGNANVVSLLAASTDGANTIGNISATGNITGANLRTAGSISATGAVTASGITVSGNVQGGNIRTTGVVSATGNIFGNNSTLQGDLLVGNSIIGGNGITSYTNIEAFNNINALSFTSSTTISAAGNITGSYFLGNGSALTGIDTTSIQNGTSNVRIATANGAVTFGVGGTGNAVVVSSTGISAIGNVTANGVTSSGTIVAAGNITTSQFFIGTFQGNISGNLTVPGSNTQVLYNNSGNAGASAGFTFDQSTNAVVTTGSITATGNITGGNIATVGAISATGNINSGNVITTNVTATTHTGTTVSVTGNITGGNVLGGANVNATTLTGTTASLSGNVTGGNVLTSGLISATGNITGGNITSVDKATVGGILTANSAQISQGLAVTGNVTAGNLTTTGTLNANVILGVTANITTTANVGTLYAGNAYITNSLVSDTISGNSLVIQGNISGGNIAVATGAVSALTLSASGNITSSGFFIGNGSQLTGLPAGYSNADVATFLAAFGSNTISTTGTVTAGNVTGGNVLTGGLISATGNITGGNVITANVLSGNISIVSNFIRNINAVNASSIPTPDRILMGNGYNGDYSSTYDPLTITRGGILQIINRVAVTNTQTNLGVRQFTSTQYADLSGQTYSAAGYRISGGSFTNFVGNGTYTATAAQWASLTGGAGIIGIGNVGNITMGNATVSHAVGGVNTVGVGTGGNIGNAVAQVGGLNILSVTGNVTSGIGFATQLVAVANLVTTPTTAIGFYHAGNTNVYGSGTGNGWRAATNYYAFKNDDDVAQVQLGSMRSYTEFNAVSATTTGALTINKTAGQVQQVNLTGNISGITYSNFVSSASDGTNTDEQSDTVTIIFNQGATGNFGVTFPTGATYKYSGNVTTLNTVAANSVTLVSVSAIRISGTTTYLTTISPGFI